MRPLARPRFLPPSARRTLSAIAASASLCLVCANRAKMAEGAPEERAAPAHASYTVFVKNGIRHFEPPQIWVRPTIEWIFPVPEPNAVGTLDEANNGVTLIKFGGGGKEPKYKVVAKNFSKTVYGNFIYRFSPGFTDDLVVYSKANIAVIVNVKTGEAFHAGFGIEMGNFMLGIRPLDSEKNLFAVVQSAADPYDFDIGWLDNMHIARLEGKRLVDLGAVAKRFNATGRISSDASIYAYNKWTVHNRTLFIGARNDDLSPKEMLCFDGLNKTTHPFAEIFNNNITQMEHVRDFVIHPNLPFGLVVGRQEVDEYDESTLYRLRWDTEGTDERFTAVHHKLRLLPKLLPDFSNIKEMGFAYPNFSPDGKWFVIGCFQYNMYSKVHFIAIPVDSARPGFLNMDDLVVLGFVNRLKSTAWSTAPTSFVVSDGALLHKWDLGELPNAAVVAVEPDGAGAAGGRGREFRENGGGTEREQP